MLRDFPNHNLRCVLGTIGKPSMSKGALKWFILYSRCIYWIMNMFIIENSIIILKIKILGNSRIRFSPYLKALNEYMYFKVIL